jgi:hypothetical protein
LRWVFVMSIREALLAVAALVMIAPPATAENANNLKYALECGAAKTTPPDDDADPIYKTKIAATDNVIYVVHYAASGETYIRKARCAVPVTTSHSVSKFEPLHALPNA